MNLAFLTFGVERVRILWIEQNVKTVSTGQRRPVGISNLFLTLHPAGSDPVLVVLKPARYAKIGFRIIQRNPVELATREFAQVVPIFSASETLVETAVGSEQQPKADLRFRWLVFIFRFRRLRWRSAARLNGKRMAI